MTLARPVTAADDPVLETVDRFFGAGSGGATVLSLWPLPDLSFRGWSLVGHPVMVVRGPGPVPQTDPREGVGLRVAASPYGQEWSTSASG